MSAGPKAMGTRNVLRIKNYFLDLLFQGIKTVQSNEQEQRLLSQAAHILFSSYLLHTSYL